MRRPWTLKEPPPPDLDPKVGGGDNRLVANPNCPKCRGSGSVPEPEDDDAEEDLGNGITCSEDSGDDDD